MDTWKQMKEEYVAGGVSYSLLAARYNVPRSTIGARAKSEHWTDLRRAREEEERETLAARVLAEHGAKSAGGPMANARSESDVGSGEEVCSSGGAYAAPDISAIADKLLFRLSALVDIMILDTQGVRQIASALKDLREIKAREAEDKSAAATVKVVFEAGEESWNE